MLTCTLRFQNSKIHVWSGEFIIVMKKWAFTRSALDQFRNFWSTSAQTSGGKITIDSILWPKIAKISFWILKSQNRRNFYLTLYQIIRKEDTIRYNTEHNIVDNKNQIRTGMTGGYYTDEILEWFRSKLQAAMIEKYPDVDERNQRYQRMHFLQGSI